MNRLPRSVAFSVWLYQHLFWFYPAVYRARFEKEQVQTFRDLCITIYSSNGWFGILKSWPRTVWDLLESANKVRAETAPNPTRTYSWSLTLMASVPLLYIAMYPEIDFIDRETIRMGSLYLGLSWNIYNLWTLWRRGGNVWLSGEQLCEMRRQDGEDKR